MAKRSRSRKAPRRETIHSLASKEVMNRMKRVRPTVVLENEADSKAYTDARSLLERTKIETVGNLETLDKLTAAVKTLEGITIQSTGSCIKDIKNIQDKYAETFEYTAQISERRYTLEEKTLHRKTA